jgi:hypothetical protein
MKIDKFNKFDEFDEFNDFLTTKNNASIFNIFYFNFYFETNVNLRFKNNSSYANLIKLDNFSRDNILFFQNTFYFKNSIYKAFSYLHSSSFIDFFIENMIDVPICFKKTKSLKFKNFELPLAKFNNLLMRKGKKEKMLNILFSTFFSFFNYLKNNLFFKPIFFKN